MVSARRRIQAQTVAICSAALETDVVREVCAITGSQAVTVAIDVKNGQVWARGGTKPFHDSPSTPLGPVAWAREMERAGAGEMLLTSIDRDGTMVGYDLELIRSVSQAVDIPGVGRAKAANGSTETANSRTRAPGRPTRKTGSGSRSERPR